jgi:transcriptional regulator with AAA-type ATPase domain
MKPRTPSPEGLLSDDATTTRMPGPSGPGNAAPRRLALSVFHPDGVQVTALSPGMPVLLGRAAPADVRIADRSLSRVHARFVLGQDERVLVTDLKSTNGTWLGGAPVDRCELPVGGEVVLGRVVVRVQALGPDEDPAGLGDEAALRAALASAIAEASRAGGRLAVLFVRGAAALTPEDTHTVAPGDVSRWAHRVQQILGPGDRIARARRDAVVALLLATDAPSAIAKARRALVRASPEEPVLLAGVAPFPDAAISADKLLDRARAAADAAGEADPVHVAREGAWSAEIAPRSAGPIFASEGMRRAIALVERAAASRVPVVLTGETGTGKEVLARHLHERSARRDRPMVSVNCGAIPAQLVESTLFGHERGAFTGAASAQKGVFEAAGGGTVFLDEVGELAPAAQAALLRVLETQRLTRVGSTREIAVDVRVIAATHRDLERMSEEGSFRSDLYYRIATMVIRIPALRERREDIPLLARHFLEGRGAGLTSPSIQPEALAALVAHDWPGNVRELRNAVERALVVAQDGRIELEDLPERVRGAAPPRPARPRPRPSRPRPRGPPPPRPARWISAPR